MRTFKNDFSCIILRQSSSEAGASSDRHSPLVTVVTETHVETPSQLQALGQVQLLQVGLPHLPLLDLGQLEVEVQRI